MGFYQDIARNYNQQSAGFLKLWAKLNIKLASARNRKIFLLQCRKFGCIPNHITNGTKNLTSLLDCHNGNTGAKIKSYNTRLEISVLNLEIKINHTNVTYYERQLSDITSKINECLPNYIFEEFKRRQTVIYNKVFHNIKRTNINKLNNLKNNLQPLIKTKENWIKNLTTTDIPKSVSDFLSLGPKFSIPPTLQDLPIRTVLADLEWAILNLTHQTKELYKAQATNTITNFAHKYLNKHNDWLRIRNETKSFLKNHPDILVLKADKGNVTVIMDKQNYIEKCLEQLNDTKYYQRINKDTTYTIQNKSNSFITKFKKNKKLDSDITKKYMIYNASIPKFYALPKIHKPELSVRPIIASTMAPNSKISALVTDILTRSYNKENMYYIKDSFEFSTFINNFQLPENYVLLSLDAVSLFTNIHLNLVNNSIKRHWSTIKTKCKFAQKDIIELIKFIFDTTIFTFNNNIYKQIMGTPMGSKVSPILAQYVLDDMLDDIIPTLPFNIPFLKKYVDDIICAIPAGEQDTILNAFNTHNQYVSFTIENETNRSVPFLDTKLIRTEQNTIILDWYIKPTSSGRYMNYVSYHDEKMKINLVLGLKHRVENICHPSFRKNNLIKLKNMLLDNNYPPSLLNKLLFSTSSRTISNLNHNQNQRHLTNPGVDSTETDIRFVSLPFVKDLTPNLINIFKNERHKLKFAKRTVLTVNKYFSITKDQTPVMQKSNIVYQIPCSMCEKIYIGETSRNLSARITSHKSDCRKYTNRCVLATHAHTLDHPPKYEDVKILMNESNTHKRQFYEMVEINNDPRCLNSRADINNLSNLYIYLLKLDYDVKNKNNTKPPDPANNSTITID